jgi:DNA polymerase-3 subunit gamma/tau
MSAPYRPRLAGLLAVATLTVSTGIAMAATPRQERITGRIAERAYARQSIAEARAARAEARVAEIAPRVPVPPPPRPATARRMARAGVPMGPPVMAGGGPPRSTPPAVVITPPPAASAAVAETPAPLRQPQPAAPLAGVPRPMPSADRADDGTTSVLTTAEEPTPATPPREPAGAAVMHPPIELLPTPAPN